MNEYLIIRLSSLGDIVHALPAFAALRRREPEARISWVVEPKGREILGLVEGLDEIIWLIALLANQSVFIHNFQFPDDQQELLDAETLELLTSPYDLLGFKDAIMSCMSKGTARHVETEDTGANPPKPMTAARSRGSSSTPARSSATRAKSTT